MINKQKITTYCIIFFIIAITIFYFFKVDSTPYIRTDEGWFAEGSYTLATEGYYGSNMFRGYYGAEKAFHFHPPFHYVILAAIFKLFGFGILQGRLLSLILSFISLFIFYKILALLFPNEEKNIKLFPILLILTTPIFYAVAKCIRPENSVLFFVLTTYYLLIRFFHVKRNTYLIFIAGITSACAIITNISGIFIFLFAVSLFIFKDLIEEKDLKTTIKNIFIYGLGFAIPFAIYLSWVISSWPEFYGQVIIQRGLEGSKLLQKLLGFILQKTKVTPYLLSLIIFIGYALKKNKSIFTSDYFVFYLLPIILFIGKLTLFPHINPLYSFVLLPFIYLNLIYIFLKTKKSFFLAAIFSLLIFVNSYGLVTYYNLYKDYDYNSYINKITQHIPKGNIVLGNVSLYIGLHESGGYEFYPFENALLGYAPNYSVLKDRIINYYKINYIIYDTTTVKNTPKGLDEFIEKHTKKVCEFISPDYGSEGESRNNLIRIYKVEYI